MNIPESQAEQFDLFVQLDLMFLFFRPNKSAKMFGLF